MVNRRDWAGLLLAAGVRLLPPERRAWGAAMRAELAVLPGRGERWRFAVGCVRVLATRPTVWRRAAYPLLAVGLLVAVVSGTAQVGYAPLRWAVTGMVATLVLVVFSGRLRPFGPVGQGRAARGLRAGGCALVGGFAAYVTAHWVGDGNPSDHARAVPIFTVVFAAYLFSVLALTARRSLVAGRVLVAGVAAGGGAAAAWTATVLLAPPIPDSAAYAITLVAAGMAVAASMAGRHHEGSGNLLAAMCAGTVAALLIVDVVAMLSAFGPARLIPDLAPAALTPADDLAQSRIELVEPYLWILLLGSLVAAVQCMTFLTARRAAPVAADPRLAEVR